MVEEHDAAVAAEPAGKTSDAAGDTAHGQPRLRLRQRERDSGAQAEPDDADTPQRSRSKSTLSALTPLSTKLAW